MKKKSSYLIWGIIISTIFVPSFVSAAQLYFKVVPSDIAGDEATVVEAYINPESQNLNTIEGIVRLEEISDELLSLVLIETGGSLLTLWPTLPKYSEDEQIIRFVGGAPNGFDQEGLLFRMRIFASRSGDVRISWIGTEAYRNDGKGTKEPTSAKSLVTSLRKGVPNQISPSSQDSTPPSFTSIEIGRDENVFDGKYFISFYALDNISGVSRYEVSEGGIVTEVFDGVYVLRDQERQTRVDITVYDHAGNSKSIRAPLRHQWITSVTLVVVIAVFGILVFILLYVYNKRRKIQKHT